jgi:hypothetical protein
MRETPVVIDGPVGQLEALYLDNEPRGIALICHPNPVQGGTMLNKVVSTLQRTARDAGLITLRFNYRGVGASEGTHDMGTVKSTTPRPRGCGPAPGSAADPVRFFLRRFCRRQSRRRLEAQGVRLKQLFMVAPAVMRLGDQDQLPQTAN